jgi:hypothetical protein
MWLQRHPQDDANRPMNWTPRWANRTHIPHNQHPFCRYCLWHNSSGPYLCRSFGKGMACLDNLYRQDSRRRNSTSDMGRQRSADIGHSYPKCSQRRSCKLSSTCPCTTSCPPDQFFHARQGSSPTPLGVLAVWASRCRRPRRQSRRWHPMSIHAEHRLSSHKKHRSTC